MKTWTKPVRVLAGVLLAALLPHPLTGQDKDPGTKPEAPKGQRVFYARTA
jgi:hypothetical protein